MRQPLVTALLLLSAPAVLLLAGLWLAGQLPWFWVLLGGGLVVAMQAPVLLGHFHHLDVLLGYLQKVRRGGGAAIGMVQHWQSGSTFLIPGLDEAIKETARERERQSQEIAQAMATSEAILSNLPDPLLLLGRDRKLLRANAAAEEMLGADLAGRDLVELLRHPDLMAAVDAALGGRVPEPVEFDLPGTVDRHLSAHIVPLHTAAPDGIAVVLALHDLTAIYRTERLRADFVANASHELRTPLSSLLGFVETLRGPAKDDPEARESFLAIMHEQAQRMARLVEDLLSLSRIELREHSPPSARVSPPKIVETVARGLEMRAESEGKTLHWDLAGCPDVVGDSDELTEVFQNLLDNAIKYSRPGTAVRVDARIARPEGDATARRLGRACVAIAVRDQGEGIAREHLARLTERFYRVDTARSRELGGTGLGLAIVKHIINRHRGLLQIESEPGKGSTFTVYLPLAERSEKAA